MHGHLLNHESQRNSTHAVTTLRPKRFGEKGVRSGSILFLKQYIVLRGWGALPAALSTTHHIRPPTDHAVALGLQEPPTTRQGRTSRAHRPQGAGGRTPRDHRRPGRDSTELWPGRVVWGRRGAPGGQAGRVGTRALTTRNPGETRNPRPSARPAPLSRYGSGPIY